MERELIVVDGRSGSGKTEWAQRLSKELGYDVVSLDEVYPGWDGLDAGQALVARTLLPLWLEHGEIAVPQWNWSTMSHASLRTVVSPRGLIVEGCGALSARTAQLAVRSVWLEVPEDERFRRAMERDGESYRAQWTRWARQEERFIALHRSPELAAERIDN
jgi:uridine kinase